jgi:hypothetical protein
MDRPLDRAAVALNMSITRANMTIAALRGAFEINGKKYSYDGTAKMVIEAIKRPDSGDPDVRYAANWLKAKKSAR